ncbi:MAG TPA: DUF2934 domain-containing protein [Terriglobales bacterium]|jgi:hypothetical protein
MPRAKNPSTTPKPKTARSKASVATNGNGHGAPADLESEIRVRAYQIYEERGFTAGDERQDWLRAEEEVKAKRATAGA